MHTGITLGAGTIYVSDGDEIQELEQIKETPVIIDNDYIGDLNSYGELTIASNINKEQFDKLFELIPKSNEICIGVDYGKEIDKTAIMKCILKREIKNVHKVKKGKRYIYKFDYTNGVNVIGEMIKESD